MTIYRSFAALRADLQAGSTTCRHVVEQYLSRIQQQSALNAFIEVYADESRTRAEAIDQKLQNGTAGRLAGMVIGLKDVLCYANHRVQAGSQILTGFSSQFTATAVQRLLDEDAIIIGRQNCDEFAMGSSNENSSFGPTLNAADTSRVPGGSSGGSAVAVQAGLCLASIGSDTGGSVRQPGAFCGVVGLKPTYGRISRWGLIAYASSFDCIGPIANTVEDAALLLEVMAGADDFDSTVSQRPVDTYSQFKTPTKPLRIACLRDGLESEGVEVSIRAALQQTVESLRAGGHTVEVVSPERLRYLLPTYYVLTTAEASSNLSRFDGVRYGYRSPDATDLLSLYKKSRTAGFGQEVRKRILLGTAVLSADYYDAYYTKAQRVRRLIRQDMDTLFGQYDLLLSPTTPTTAFRLGEKTDRAANPLAMYLADVFTVLANVVGYPAISVPVGTDADGLPIGLQLMSAPFTETQLLAAAALLAEKKLAAFDPKK